MLFKTGKEIVLAIPDYHAPFGHRDSVPFLKEVQTKFKATKIINLGDEADQCAISSFDSDPDGYSAGHELEAAIKQLEEMYKAFPNVMVCESNHMNRIIKKQIKAGLPSKFFKTFQEIMEAPKTWTWKNRWIIDNVIYEHGEGVSGATGHIAAARANMKSTVIGHLHAFAGVQYITNPYEQFFGMNAGCLIDEDAYAFAYAKHMKNKPVLGCGVVNKGIPYFIPMIVDKHKRWIGRIT